MNEREKGRERGGGVVGENGVFITITSVLLPSG